MRSPWNDIGSTGTIYCSTRPKRNYRSLFLFHQMSPKHCVQYRRGQSLIRDTFLDRKRGFAIGSEGLATQLQAPIQDSQHHKAGRIEEAVFPQMFRDTFAVELLLSGVPLDQVSILLGHSSVKITEKHYAPWSKLAKSSSRQAFGNPGILKQSLNKRSDFG